MMKREHFYWNNYKYFIKDILSGITVILEFRERLLYKDKYSLDRPHQNWEK